MRAFPRFAICINVVGLLAGCDSMCGNEIVQTSLSPSGNLTAVVFSRNCGTTTSFNTQVSVLTSAQLPTKDSGNLLVVDDQIDLQLSWVSESQLSIRGVGSSQVFKQEAHAAGVSVSVK